METAGGQRAVVDGTAPFSQTLDTPFREQISIVSAWDMLPITLMDKPNADIPTVRHPTYEGFLLPSGRLVQGSGVILSVSKDCSQAPQGPDPTGHGAHSARGPQRTGPTVPRAHSAKGPQCKRPSPHRADSAKAPQRTRNRGYIRDPG
ncbi:unnamed protein product [Gadus morhua 'NCC']